MKRDALDRYRSKRIAGKTPEPGLLPSKARSNARTNEFRFVVQLHWARRRHYDFRLELDGSLKSWAVPKGPSLDPKLKRLAVQVEDHPLDYGAFEGSIPPGHYGAGEVCIWDRGLWQPAGSITKTRTALRDGHLDFELQGERLHGAWSLIRTTMKASKPQWLLIKQPDAAVRASDEADERSLEQWRAQHEKTRLSIRRVPTGLGTRAAFPDWVALPLARLVVQPPAGDDWLHEIKFDGYRVLLFRSGRDVRIESRNGVDYTTKLPEIAAALRKLKPSSFVLDGELVALDEAGRTQFGLVQDRLGSGGPLTVMVFDAPYLDRRDLRDEPLLSRKQLLSTLQLPEDGPLQLVDHHLGNGPALFRAARDAGLEGLVSKSVAAPYRAGRGGEWLKTKCVDSDEFVVVGFTPGRGARAALGSLLLAVPGSGKTPWRYVGRVGSGFDEATLRRLGQQLKPTRKPVVLDAPPSRAQLLGATPVWVTPKQVVEIEFRGWTPDGLLRQAAFKTFRTDRTIGSLLRAPPPLPEMPDVSEEPSMVSAPSHAKRRRRTGAKQTDSKDAVPASFTHPERQLYSDPPITKADLGRFYAAIAESILPELVGRPLSLLRCPGGTDTPCFFQKHLTPGFGDAVREHASGHGAEKLPYIEDLEGLLALVQMNVIEFHPWGARISDLEHPDRMVFDLDPAADVRWSAVVNAAREIRERLLGLKLESFVRTSGGKGLHVVVPLSGKDPWAAVKAFAQAMAQTLHEESPDRYIDVATKTLRKGRIFVDYLRNGRGSTSVASYSLRARPGAGAATPLRWSELSRVRSGAQFGFSNLRQRLARIDDPWAGIADIRQALPKLSLQR